MQEKTERNKEILRLNNKGLGARRIARMYDITPPRVTKILQTLRSKRS